MKRKTSIIILTYNNLEYTRVCLESIKQYTRKNTYEIIVIDNASTDGTAQYLKEIKDIKVILNKENLGFPKGCNEGINFADKENDILFLNNDTVVTTNWLDNLKTCLYSDKKIGAVGAVCNKNENRQGVDFPYDSLEEMQKLTQENNISNKDKWEEKVFLIGFCILIKREVINKIKELDENYSPGYIEDNDLSLRIVKMGYKLMLCHDVFIHHYLGTAFRKDLNKFYSILYKNRDYFYNKWKFNTFSFDDIKSASYPLIKNPKKILDINCGIGVTILELKYKFKNTIIEGVESNDNKRDISKHFTRVFKNLKEVKDKYDYILIGSLLEQKESTKFLQEVKNCLTDNGYLIGEFTNYSNIKIINKLLKGECLNIFKENKNYFTPIEIKKLLKENNFLDCNFFYWYEYLTEEEKELLSLLEEKNKYIKYTYYTFKTKKAK